MAPDFKNQTVWIFERQRLVKFAHLVEHHWFHAVTQYLSKLSGQHGLATTLENTKIIVIKPVIPFMCELVSEHGVSGTLAPIRHMSFTMWDCIISDSSWEWLGVLMKLGLLFGGRGSLVPAGTCRTTDRGRVCEAVRHHVTPCRGAWGFSVTAVSLWTCVTWNVMSLSLTRNVTSARPSVSLAADTLTMAPGAGTRRASSSSNLCRTIPQNTHIWKVCLFDFTYRQRHLHLHRERPLQRCGHPFPKYWCRGKVSGPAAGRTT